MAADDPRDVAPEEHGEERDRSARTAALPWQRPTIVKIPLARTETGSLSGTDLLSLPRTRN